MSGAILQPPARDDADWGVIFIEVSGLLPMCAWCKKIRDDEGYWEQVEDYFGRRSQIKFTHGVCVECLETMKGRGAAVPVK